MGRIKGIPTGKRTDAPVPLERDVQAAVRDTITARGGLVIRVNSGGVRLPGRGGKTGVYRMNDQPGCSDLVACYRSHFLSLEIKRPGKTADAPQAASGRRS